MNSYQRRKKEIEELWRSLSSYREILQAFKNYLKADSPKNIRNDIKKAMKACLFNKMREIGLGFEVERLSESIEAGYDRDENGNFVEEQKTTFKEQLELAKKNNIDISQVTIAYEVDCTFDQGSERPDFNELCEAVWLLWLKTGGLSIETLTKALKHTLDDGATLKDVLAYGPGWDKTIERATYEGCY